MAHGTGAVLRGPSCEASKEDTATIFMQFGGSLRCIVKHLSGFEPHAGASAAPYKSAMKALGIMFSSLLQHLCKHICGSTSNTRRTLPNIDTHALARDICPLNIK